LPAYLITGIPATKQTDDDGHRARAGESADEYGAGWFLRGGQIEMPEDGWQPGHLPMRLSRRMSKPRERHITISNQTSERLRQEIATIKLGAVTRA
jgi:hypothetical protein